MNITSFEQTWETFVAQFPAQVSRETELCAKLRDLFYAGAYHAIMIITEDFRELPQDEVAPAIEALREEVTAYMDTNCKSYSLS